MSETSEPETRRVAFTFKLDLPKSIADDLDAWNASRTKSGKGQAIGGLDGDGGVAIEVQVEIEH